MEALGEKTSYLGDDRPSNKKTIRFSFDLDLHLGLESAVTVAGDVVKLKKLLVGNEESGCESSIS